MMRPYMSTPVMHSLRQRTMHPSGPSSIQLVLSLCLSLSCILDARRNLRKAFLSDGARLSGSASLQVGWEGIPADYGWPHPWLWIRRGTSSKPL